MHLINSIKHALLYPEHKQNLPLLLSHKLTAQIMLPKYTLLNAIQPDF